jgi:hypothetical protein
MNRRIALQSAAAAGLGILASDQADSAGPVAALPPADGAGSPGYIVTRDGVRLAHKDWGTGEPGHGLCITHMDRLKADLVIFAKS